jgi:hypothetical protein
MYKQVPHEDGLPLNSRQVSLDEDGYDLPSDWYLQLATEIQMVMDGRKPLSEEIPLSPKRLFELVPFPSDGATGVSQLPELKWTKAVVAHNYRIYLKQGTPGFSETDLVSTQSDTTLAILNELQAGTWYWRVDVLTNTQVFTGNAWSFSVEEDNTGLKGKSGGNIRIYPIPAGEEIFVEGLPKETAYTIYDIMGVKRANGIMRDRIDISDLSSGIYLLRLEGRPVMRFTRK